VRQKEQDVEQLRQIRQLEIQKYTDEQQLQVQEAEAQITEMQMKVSSNQEILNEQLIELDSVETEKNLEVSHYQNEIRKLEEDIETVNEKLTKMMSDDVLSPEA
jgi:ubiquinone biosynthesis protein UbiJ